jgi:Fe-S cluster assembly protein SufD
MTSMTETSFLDTLLAPRQTLPVAPNDWLKARRSAALEMATALPVPTVRDEDWRFTDLSPLYRLKLQPTEKGQVAPSLLGLFALPEAGARLVFVDGRHAPELSTTETEAGLFAGPLANALESHGEMLEQRLAAVAPDDGDMFTAVNTAFLQDAAVIIAGPGARSERPVHVLHVSTGRETAAHPRILIVAEKAAACTVVEDFVAIGGIGYFTNCVTEIAVAGSAQVRHVKVQREAETAFHMANTSVHLEREARYRSWSVSLGGRISRHNLNVRQASEAIECEVDGLALISGRQLADTHSTIDHAFANGRSRQLHKTVVGGSAHSVFNGKIFVRAGAQKTDSAQQSRNLLLTPGARVDTKPQLEIFADDVKCAHGATVGQIDAEEVFYLKSRGLSDSTARNLLTYAFAAEVVERIPVRSLVRALERVILEQTQKDQQ